MQIIKKDPRRIGQLQFGTEVVTAGDGSLAAVLGASPGASTVVSIVCQVLQRCFPEDMSSDAWITQLVEMVPAYGKNLAGDRALYTGLRARTETLLQIGTPQAE